MNDKTTPIQPAVDGPRVAAAAAATAARDRSFDDVRADLKALRDDLGSVLKGLYEDNRVKLKEVKDKVVERTGDAASLAGDKIRSRPLLALMVAFVIGLLLGNLLRRH